ncbi:Protein kinase protein rad53, partial [Exophiala xenobiotica]
MDDLNIFLTLTPFDEWGLTIDSFRLPHNAGRYVKPSPISRGTTPSEYGQDETPASQLEDFHRIQLRFNQKTKVKGRITFGSDPDQCDVLLESTRPRFYVSFDSEQRPAIWDDSNNGLTVSYDGQGKNDLRNHFKWIFFP